MTFAVVSRNFDYAAAPISLLDQCCNSESDAGQHASPSAWRLRMNVPGGVRLLSNAGRELGKVFKDTELLSWLSLESRLVALQRYGLWLERRLECCVRVLDLTQRPRTKERSFRGDFFAFHMNGSRFSSKSRCGAPPSLP